MDPLARWIADLEHRHLARFEFAEVRKALQALSSVYVERRHRLGEGAALDSDGKRAAFALFYAPLHFLFAREAIAQLGAGAASLSQVVDLGCGTGPAGAAWAAACGAGCTVRGYERHSWAAVEAKKTFSALGVSGKVEVGDLARARFGGQGVGIVAAYTVNELPEPAREALKTRLLEAAKNGARVLVIEPLSRRAADFWPRWEKEWLAAGGRADEWRFPMALPDILKKLDHAAGLDHRQLGGRTLWLG